MAVLILRLIKENFHDELTGYKILLAKAGKELVSIEFHSEIEIPKILKTVEYKAIGDWRKMRSGKRIFSISKIDKIAKTKFAKPKLHYLK